ncbi:nitrite reductase small subunit NirD [Pseudooceanicola onchidii]|uniref:nitrite reductase small subunit NirD n=1 Tax=Pseudooceanicola onchidii TaxID=2562279 RepID=UPI0010AB12BA|nr:nitrite reductase small subunit NirD [Pseudooceanicola onchidii]
MSWIDIGSLDDVPLRGARVIKTPVGCIALFRTAEAEVFAASNTCPHKAGPLAEGIVHGQKITCPLHNWVFDLNTGEAIGEDARITTYPVRVEGDRVQIDAASIGSRRVA